MKCLRIQFHILNRCHIVVICEQVFLLLRQSVPSTNHSSCSRWTTSFTEEYAKHLQILFHWLSAYFDTMLLRFQIATKVESGICFFSTVAADLYPLRSELYPLLPPSPSPSPSPGTWARLGPEGRLASSARLAPLRWPSPLALFCSAARPVPVEVVGLPLCRRRAVPAPSLRQASLAGRNRRPRNARAAAAGLHALAAVDRKEPVGL